MKKLNFLIMLFMAFSLCYAEDPWVKVEIGIPYSIGTVKFLDTLTGFLQGSLNLTKTTDGGATWQQKMVIEFTGNGIACFDIFSDGYGFMMREHEIYSISTDFGETWTDYPVPSQHYYTALRALDHNRIWVMAGTEKIIIFTSDGGKNWDSLKFDNFTNFKYLNDFIFFNEQTSIIATEKGTILKTTDSGKNWVEISTGVNTNLYELYFIDDNNGWLGGLKGVMLRTTDGGATWHQITSPSNNDIVSIYFLNENEGFVSVMIRDGSNYSGEIYYTNDGGMTWQFQHKETDYIIGSFFFLNKDLGWATAGTGSILRYDRTTSVDEKISEKIDKRTVFLFSDRKVHPMPASSEVSANVYWNEQYYLIENAKIKVYTSYGDEITNPEISIEKLAPYKANIKWNCSNFASGIYFIYISLGDENMAIPVIVSR